MAYKAQGIQEVVDIIERPSGVFHIDAIREKGGDLLAVDIRRWYMADDGMFKPTQKGVRLDVDGLKRLKQALETLGI